MPDTSIGNQPDPSPTSPDAHGVLLLIGYGGAAPDAFFAAVAAAAPDECVDIRLKPWGWHERYRSGRFLAELREASGGSARHEPGLGNPGHFDQRGMRLSDERALLPLVAALAAGHRLLLICGCGRGDACHRSLVAARLREQLPDLEVCELGPLPSAPRTKVKA